MIYPSRTDAFRDEIRKSIASKPLIEWRRGEKI